MSQPMHWISSRRRLAEEGGFTIIEASVAMLIVAMMFTALSAGLIGGLRAVRDARLYQLATAIGQETIEAARNLQYDTLVMQTSDLSGDPRIQSGPPIRFDPDGPGSLVAEPVVASSSVTPGSIVPHITTETVGNTIFTTSRYVTWVDDATQGGPAQNYKRMVVIIEWPMGNRTNSYRTSTFIALARRGLPVPKFTLAPEAQIVEVEPGNPVVLPHTIRNLGIVDTYDVEMTINPRNWVVNFYKDGNQNGTFEPVEDTLLLDTNSTGKPDTGSVQTGATTYFLAVLVLSPTEAPPGPVDMTLTATSGANNAVTRTAKETVVVGFAGITLTLHNKPSPPAGDTTAQTEMDMNLTPPSATTLFRYSTNYPPVQPGPGRYINRLALGAGETETRPEFMANWIYQLPDKARFNGTVRLKLWVARYGFDCGGPAHIRAFLRDKKNPDDGSGTSLATGNALVVPTGIDSCPFQEIILTMTLANVEVSKSRYLELKVTNQTTPAYPVLIAYDTTNTAGVPAQYQSTLRLPQVSSG